MLADLKNTIKQSAIYGLSRISTKFVALLLLPIYSLYFSTAEYGIIVRVEILWQIFFAIFIFGFESGVVLWYNSIENANGKKIFLFTITVFIFAFNLLLTSIIFLSSNLFSALLFESKDYSTLVFYSALIATIEALSFLLFLFLRIKEKAFAYSLFSIITSILILLAQLYFIFYAQNKLNGIFIAKIIAPAIVMIILLPYYFKNLKIGFDSKSLFGLLKYSYPIMLASLLSTLLNQSDRYLIGFFKSSSDVGIYGLAYNICGLLNFLIIGPYLLAFSVISWKKYKNENAKRFFTKNITYLFFVVTYLAFILSLMIPNLIKIFTLNPDYWIAKDIIPYIAISMSFYGISAIGFFSFYATKKTHYVLYIFLISLLSNIILNLFLIPLLNLYGAAIANLVSFLLLCILNYIYSRKNYFFLYEWEKIFKIILVYVVLLFPFVFFQLDEFTVEIFSLKIISIILFPIILFFLKFYEEIEKEKIKGFFNKYIFQKLK